MTEAKSKTKTVLVHRRRDLEYKEFEDEKTARKYADDNKLLIVHENKDSDGTLRLHYLPE